MNGESQINDQISPNYCPDIQIDEDHACVETHQSEVQDLVPSWPIQWIVWVARWSRVEDDLSLLVAHDFWKSDLALTVYANLSQYSLRSKAIVPGGSSSTTIVGVSVFITSCDMLIRIDFDVGVVKGEVETAASSAASIWSFDYHTSVDPSMLSPTSR